MKKLIVCLFLVALSFVTSSFVPVNSVAMERGVDGSPTTCPACGCENTYYNTKSGVFTCPHCKCEWKRLKGDDVIIVAPPSDDDAKIPGNP